MIKLFFVLCALVVTVTATYHWFPSSAHTAFVLQINGAGWPVTWLAMIGLFSLVVYWRTLGKSH
jgi:hypothetical protein